MSPSNMAAHSSHPLKALGNPHVHIIICRVYWLRSADVPKGDMRVNRINSVQFCGICLAVHVIFSGSAVCDPDVHQGNLVRPASLSRPSKR